MANPLIMLHAALSLGGYALFTLGAVWSGLYLFLHRRLKEKQWTSPLMRLPSLEKLESYAFRTSAAGALLLLLAVVPGFWWIYLQDRPSYITDWKVWNSLAVLGAYLIYTVLGAAGRMPGDRLAVWNLLSFALVLINSTGANQLSAFHHWIWM